MKTGRYFMRTAGSDYVDIEERFPGLRYMKCEGLEDKGEVKNIYTESYSDGDELRVYMPNYIKRDATTITLTLAFFGDRKQQIYDNFCKFIEGVKLYYRDTVRNREAYMIMKDAIKPSEDEYKGHPYMIVSFKFQNLRGRCEMSLPVPDGVTQTEWIYMKGSSEK